MFDFDGTLADTYAWFAGALESIAGAYGIRRVGPDEAEALRGMEARAIVRHLGIPAWKLPLIARRMRALAARDCASLRLFPGIPAMLERLDGHGIALAVVSSNGEDTIRRVLGPLAPRIRHYECGAGLFGKARRLRRALKACGGRPETTLAVGDEMRDLDAARAVACAFGAVGWGYTRADALAARAPDHLFQTPEAILALVTGAA